MKTVKTIFKVATMLIVFSAILQSCKKDEDTEKGNFTINGEKSEVTKCYIAPRCEEQGLYDVIFVSEGISAKNSSEITGIGNVLGLVITSSLDTTIIETGDYEYNSDNSLPFTYFDCSIATNLDVSNNDYSGWLEPTTETIFHIENLGNNNYTFSASGQIDGEPFSFTYNGPVTYFPPCNSGDEE